MNFLVAALVAGLALGVTGAWQVQDWRYEKTLSGRALAAAQATTTAVEQARAEEQSNYDRIQESERAAKLREAAQRAAAERAAAESRGLRDQLTALRGSVPALTEAAVRDYADTLGGLLGDCANRYQGMAERAQQHALDAERLLAAWPSNLVE